jgi:hydrogenase-1 operon protein HyaE
MPSPLIHALSERHGLPVVSETDVDRVICDGHGLLFFSGDPNERTDANDVAVVLPQLLAAFSGRLTGAVVARDAEAALKPRFQVQALPSLVITRDGQPVGVIGKIRDWAEYCDKIEAALAPDAAIITGDAPRVTITYSGRSAVQ